MMKTFKSRSGYSRIELVVFVGLFLFLFAGVVLFARDPRSTEARELSLALRPAHTRILSEAELTKIETLLERMKSNGEESMFYREANRLAAQHYHQNLKNSLTSLPEPQRTLAKGTSFDYLYSPFPQEVKDQFNAHIAAINKQAAALADYQAHPDRYTLALESPEIVAVLRNHEAEVLGQKLSGQFKVLTLRIEDFQRIMKATP